ncbi:MAG: T9SS type A sorting domain-containing protein, partial [Bacteroidetes bacterium]|nr:T9SS type A sorting domain-containing protein [Bacteroidota bacterium]
NAATYCAANTDGLNGVCHRALVRTGDCAAVASADACLTVESFADFVSQPQDAVVCGGESLTFTGAAVVGAGYAGDVAYRWQASPNGGLTWQNLSNDANISGAFSNELSIGNVSSLNGWQFRLQASTGLCDPRHSGAAQLTVEGPVEFSQQPQTVTVCPDDEVEFAVSAENLGAGSLQLQWQVSQGGTAWTDIAEGGNYSGTQTQTLHVGQAAGLDGFQYRLVAHTALCEAQSDAVTLTLEDELTCNPPTGDDDCVMLAVKKLDNNIGWSVWVKADSSFTETPYQLPTGGKVTLVAPIGFAFQGLTSQSGGKWKTGKVFFNPPQDPGKVYVEFNLTPNQNFLELAPGVERLLFSFSVVNGCPTSLMLMDSIVPPGFSRNEFTGFGAGDGPNVPFHFCGAYAQGEWECPPTWNSVGIESDFDFAEEMETEQDLNGGYSIENEQVAPHFGLYPNPVRDELTVVFDEAMAGKSASLRLWNLQGKLLLHENIEGETSSRLDFRPLTAGLYFLTLEVDGRVVQRERVVVQ